MGMESVCQSRTQVAITICPDKRNPAPNSGLPLRTASVLAHGLGFIRATAIDKHGGITPESSTH
jgi:hypothetical protein